MAVLSEIRKRPWILMGVIALALLAFLINPSSLQKAFGTNPNILGKVNGDEITRDEFNQQLTMLQNQAQSQGQPTAGLEEQAWQSLVQSKLIKQQFDKLGLKMTDDFFWNQIQYDPMFAQNPQYFDAKGNFKVTELKKQIEQLRTSGKAQEYNQWLNIRKSIEYRIMARQVLGNVVGAITTSKPEASLLLKNRDQVADISYVKIDYAAYAQKHPVKVTTKDLADFIKKHPIAFKTEAARNIAVAYFPATPSANDDSLALKQLNQLYKTDEENFTNTKNDSLFVEINSEAPVKYQYVSIQDVPQEAQEFVKSASVGQYFGPYKSGEKYYVTKLEGKTEATLPKHILISYAGTDVAKQYPSIKRTKEQAKKLADSIAAAVKADPNKFNEFVGLSADVNSARQGGLLQWAVAGHSGMVKPFADWIDSNPKDAVGVVETQFGYHIIVNQNKMPVYKIANLAKDITASKNTQDKIYADANKFIQSVQGKSFNDFSNLAKKGNYIFLNPKQVNRFQGAIPGLGTDKDDAVLAWAFDKKTNRGDTNIFTTSDGGYIVVCLNGKQEAGLSDPETVRDRIEDIVKNEIIGKQISEQIKNAKAGSLEKVASMFGVTVQEGQINILNPSIGNAMEPKVAGAAFGVEKGHLSMPVEGNTGVFVLVRKNITENKQPGDVEQIIQMVNQQGAQMFSQSLMKSLENSADIKDYRIEVSSNKEQN